MGKTLAIIWNAVLVFCRKDPPQTNRGEVADANHEFMLDKLIVADVRKSRRPRFN